MQRYLPQEILLKNLREEFSPSLHPTLYLSKDETLELLRLITQQDFGDDIEAWENWFKDNPANKSMPGFFKN